MEVNEGNSSDKFYHEEYVSESAFGQIVHRCWSLVAKCYSKCWELDNVPLFLKKVFHSESRDAILLRGEGYNTPGVYHQLSSGFKLKHDRLVEMTMPKLNLWK
jgi:hypothetical protein